MRPVARIDNILSKLLFNRSISTSTSTSTTILTSNSPFKRAALTINRASAAASTAVNNPNPTTNTTRITVGHQRRMHSNTNTTTDNNNTNFNTNRWALIYGGNGSLGQSIVTQFNSAGWNTISCDYYANNTATISMLLDSKLTWKQNTQSVLQRLQDQQQLLQSNQSNSGNNTDSDTTTTHTGPNPTSLFSLSAVISAAGGWKGGDISSTAIYDSVDTLFETNVHSGISAAIIAQQYLQPNSLLVLTGAATVAAGGTPTMIGYGISKAAIHQLVLSLAEPESQLPINTTVCCLLPITIDTPSNRQFMPAANYGNFTPPAVFAETIINWSKWTEANKSTAAATAASAAAANSSGLGTATPNSRTALTTAPPVNGGFYQFNTRDGHTQIVRIEIPFKKGN